MRSLPKTLAIDPGVHHCGVSLFVGDQLTQAGLARAVMADTEPVRMIRGLAALTRSWGIEDVNLLVCEHPQAYPGSHIDPNVLVRLGAVMGAVCGAYEHTNCILPYPRMWKTNVKKETTIAHAQATLSPQEMSCIVLPEEHLAHNVWDAVALGLWAVRRGYKMRG